LAYGIPVVLHTDHCAKKLLPWVDGLLEAGEKYFAVHGEPLYSSHMLDLSEEPMEENIAVCKEYVGVGMMSRLAMRGENGVLNGRKGNLKHYPPLSLSLCNCCMLTCVCV
jgi:fructose-bisphosphate aldolase class II